MGTDTVVDHTTDQINADQMPTQQTNHRLKYYNIVLFIHKAQIPKLSKLYHYLTNKLSLQLFANIIYCLLHRRNI